MSKEKNAANKSSSVVIIGGANVDITGKTNEAPLYETSNPGNVQVSLGGVGRNIAHNLHYLGVESFLITAVGKDIYGDKILSECKEIGLNLEHSLVVKGGTSGIYLSVLGEDGEMVIALSQMDVFEKLTPAFLEEKTEIIKNAKVIVVDTNIPRKSIELILEIAVKNNNPVFLDTVSLTKAKNIKDIIGQFHTIKPNLLELELLVERKIDTLEEIKIATEILLSKGVKEIVVSLGKEGAFYHDGKCYGRVPGFSAEVKNTTGAGDAFLAGLVYGTLFEKSLREKVVIGLGCGAITVESYNTISDKLNPSELKRIIRDL
ncbi:MAG: carbohydrate kinase family protein [Clostridiaceae bacterium]|nr:carbohydrate kinase family protein [Clostridiaceae bacterium]